MASPVQVYPPVPVEVSPVMMVQNHTFTQPPVEDTAMPVNNPAKAPMRTSVIVLIRLISKPPKC